MPTPVILGYRGEQDLVQVSLCGPVQVMAAAVSYLSVQHLCQCELQVTLVIRADLAAPPFCICTWTGARHLPGSWA
jgi:hypothetical protein